MVTDERLQWLPADYIYLGREVMSNFDHKIDSVIAERLKREKLLADYPAWNFHATVWFDAEKEVFKAHIMCYHCHVDTIEAPTLEEIMTLASNRWGWD